jgi:hypothetical protein
MNTESRGSRVADGSRLERAIVLQLLRDDRPERWSLAELGAEIGAEAPAVEEALRRLNGEGVLHLAAEEVWASGAVRRLDQLGLISV